MTFMRAQSTGAAIAVNEDYVVPCLGSGSPSWCFEGGTEATRYATDAGAVTRSVQDLRAILYAIRPI